MSHKNSFGHLFLTIYIYTATANMWDNQENLYDFFSPVVLCCVALTFGMSTDLAMTHREPSQPTVINHDQQVCNPIELVKTRQQGASAGDTSYKYRGPIHGLRKLHATEGVKGMWRGTGISMIRSASVTGPHLTTYSYVKEVFVEKQWMRDSTPLHILASLCGGFTGIVCNHPFDLVRNRLYNQPLTADGKGVLYDGVRDCMKKLAKTEGLKGFYRGFVAHYMRVGPHYVITFSILEQVRKALSPSEE